MGHSETTANLPALIPGEKSRARPRIPTQADAKAFGDPAFGAQLMGQSGARRGLKGGGPVLTAARGAYLSAEWSGETDRRPRAGLVKATEI